MAKEPIDDLLTVDSELQLASEQEKLLDDLGIYGDSRRELLKQLTAAGVGALAFDLLSAEKTAAFGDAAPADASSFLENALTVAFRVNGSAKSLEVDSRMVLLDALRERLGLTGTKKGCDHGQCGACTVIVDGRRINNCLTLAVMHDGDEITTIEGLGTAERLHPMQRAFVKHDAFQCGYCTPGQ